MKNTQGLIRKALEKWTMLEDGDRVAVAVSGGKDSLSLLKHMAEIRRYFPKKFELYAISVDMYNGNTDFTAVSTFCEALGVPHHIVKTQIYELLFEVRKETNPCSLCAKIRRGALANKATELGCNKLALGHHSDDLVETFFLSLFYEGRISTFAPVTFLSRSKVTVIRPLMLVWESAIIAESGDLPVLHNPCPANKNTKREFIKNHIHELEFKIPKLKNKVLSALISPERTHLFEVPVDSE